MKQSYTWLRVVAALILSMLLFTASETFAQVNSYTNTASGKWETAANWSLDLAPSNTQSIYVTNLLTKTVTIDTTTASTPSTLTINGLTLAAPSGATNTLALNSLGFGPQLVVNNSLTIGKGGSLSENYSLLVVDCLGGSFGFLGLAVGLNCPGQQLMITNGGVMSCHDGGVLGAGSSSTNNTMLVDGPGSVWGGSSLFVGFASTGNSLVISNQGMVSDTYGTVGEPAGSNNTVLVTGPGSAWINSSLYLGDVSAGNSLVISHQGQVADGSGYVGYSGSNNTVLVTDPGSLWLNQTLTVGYSSGAGNSVTISNGGSLVVTNNGSGQLFVSQGGGSNSLILNGGSVTVDNLIAPNGSNSVVTFNSGFLTSGGTTVSGSNTPVFVIGDGADLATYNMLSGGHTFANGLQIRTNALLTGCGTVTGNVLVQGSVQGTCGTALNFMGTVTNNGILTALNSTTLNFYGPVVNDGLINGTNGSVYFYSSLANNGTVLNGTVLSGTPAQIVVTPAVLNLGPVAMGGAAQGAFVITNVGVATATNGTAVINGPFSIAAGSMFTVAANSLVYVTVQFSSAVAGSFTSSCIITTANGGSSTNLVSATVDPGGPNSYINSANGKWENGSNWSLGVPPDFGQPATFITNASSKIITIDSVTASNAPDSLSISNLTVSAPVGDTNTLALHDTSLEVGLYASGSPYSSSFDILTVDVGGSLIVSNAQLNADVTFLYGMQPYPIGHAYIYGNVTLQETGGLSIEGTTLDVSGDSTNPVNILVNGGTLSGDFSDDSFLFSGTTSLTVSNGVVTGPPLILDGGTMTIAGGTVAFYNNDNNFYFYGIYNQGAIWLTGGSLRGDIFAGTPSQYLSNNSQVTVSNGVYMGGINGGVLTVASSGTVVAATVGGGGGPENFSIAGGTVVYMNGGTLIATNDFVLGGEYTDGGSEAPAIVNISGGNVLISSLVIESNNAVLNISGGNVTVLSQFNECGLTNSSSSVHITGGSVSFLNLAQLGAGVSATAILQLSGGQLLATNSVIGIGNDGTSTNGFGTGHLVVSNGTLLASTILLGSSVGGHGDLTIQTNGVVSFDSSAAGTNTELVANDVIIDGGVLELTNGTIECGQDHPGAMLLSNGTVNGAIVYIGDNNNGTLALSGGQMSVANQLVVGENGGGTGYVWMTGGSLVATNDTTIIGNFGVGQLTVSNGSLNASRLRISNSTNPGTLSIQGGSLTVNLQIEPYGRFQFGSGQLVVTATTSSNGQAFVVGNGSQAATMTLQGGIHSFDAGLMVARQALLTGCGTINGTVVNNGAITNGCAGGALNFGGAVTNNGVITAINGAVLNFTGTLVNNGLIDASGGIANFAGSVSGTGTVLNSSAMNALLASPSAYDFGSVATGTTVVTTFLLTNASAITLYGSGTVNGQSFAISAGSYFSLPKLNASPATVSFTPPTVGSFTGTVVFSSTGGTVTNLLTGTGVIPPQAGFMAEPTNGLAPLAVTFNDTSTGTITNRFWEFGDGGTTNTSLTNLVYVYQSAGTDTVSLTVFGLGGSNTATQAATILATNVVAADTNPPVIMACAPAVTNQAIANCQAAVPDFTADVQATDNITPSNALIKTQAPVAGTLMSTGTTPVTIVVQDAAGNTATCATSFVVIDLTAPMITVCAPVVTNAAGANCQATVPDFTAHVQATDNCTASNALVKTQSPVAGTPVGSGITPVTIIVQDTAGNTATCLTSFVVNDLMIPSITACAPPVTVTVDASGQAPVPDFTTTVEATDNCTESNALIKTQAPVAGTMVPVGTTPVTITVKDAVGNVVTCGTSFTLGAIPVSAGFSANPTNGRVPLMVSFANLSTGTITTTAWNFGDGGVSSLADPTHTYTNASSFTVSLTVAGPGGTNTLTQPNYITVLSVLPPVITSGPVVSNVFAEIGNLAVILVDATNWFGVTADDPGGNQLGYQWQFGDGVTNPVSAQGLAAHVYTTNCDPYAASVTVSNGAAAVTSNLAVTVACEMTVTKLQVKLDFAKTNSDTATLAAPLELGVESIPAGTPATVVFGGVAETFSLNAKGLGASPAGTCKLTNSKSKGWLLTVALKNGSWHDQLAGYGMQPGPVAKTGVAVSLPVVVVVGNEAFAVDQPLTYTAPTAKTGSAR